MAWQNDMRRIADELNRRGDVLGQQNQDWTRGDEESQRRYQQELDEYRRMLMEEGGYTEEEARNILQSEGFQSLLFGDQAAQDAFLTQDEEQEIRGNPWAAKDAYDTRGLYGVLGEGAANQRGAFNVDTAGADAALGGMRGDFRRAIDAAELGPGEGYGETTRGILGRGRGGVLDPLEQAEMDAREGYARLGDRVGISDRYRDAMTVGDDEVQGIQNAAANRVRSGTERMIQDAQRRAAEGGNANALAVGAFEQQARQATAQDAAAAAAEARLGALRYRRDSEDMLESKRLAGEMAGANLEGTGLATSVGLRRDMSGANRDLLGLELGVEGDIEDRRFRGEAAGLEAEMDAARTVGMAGLGEAQQRRQGRAGIESEIAGRELGVRDADLMRRVALEQEGEERQQGRAAALGFNRQATRQGNVDRRYQQNVGIYDRNRAGYGQVAGQRIDDRNQAGSMLGNQWGQYNQNVQQGRDRQAQIYGQQSGAVNNAMGNWGQARSQPGFWGRTIGAAVGGLASGGWRRNG